jgi:hypothetical protein
LCSNMEVSNQGEPWLSEPFYSHIGGYKLQLELHFIKTERDRSRLEYKHTYKYKYTLLDNVVPLPANLRITAQIKEGGVIRDTRRDTVRRGGRDTELTLLEINSTGFFVCEFHLLQIEIA